MLYTIYVVKVSNANLDGKRFMTIGRSTKVVAVCTKCVSLTVSGAVGAELLYKVTSGGGLNSVSPWRQSIFNYSNGLPMETRWSETNMALYVQKQSSDSLRKAGIDINPFE